MNTDFLYDLIVALILLMGWVSLCGIGAAILHRIRRPVSAYNELYRNRLRAAAQRERYRTKYRNTRTHH